jgi:Protein of unknown function, DUF481
MMIGRSGLAVLLVGLWGGVAAAQAQTPPAEPAPAAAPQPPSPPQAPAEPVKWHGGATFGFSWQSGTSRQTAVSLDGRLYREGKVWSHAIVGSHVFTEVKVAGFEQVVADAQLLRLLSERELNHRFYLLLRPGYKRDTVQGIKYQVEELVGFGIRIVRTPRAELNIVPVAGLTQQDKGVAKYYGDAFTGGVFQQSEIALVCAKPAPVPGACTPTWRWNQYFVYLQNAEASEDRRMQGQVMLTGVIKGPFSMSLAYVYDRENVVQVGNTETNKRVTVGLQVEF